MHSHVLLQYIASAPGAADLGPSRIIAEDDISVTVLLRLPRAAITASLPLLGALMAIGAAAPDRAPGA